MTPHRPYVPQNEVLEPAADGATWRCGHPKTPINTQHIGKSGDRCRICRRRIAREHDRRKRGFYRMG
jgi:hypothetical protein